MQEYCNFRMHVDHWVVFVETDLPELRTRTRPNTNPNATEANAAGRSGNARALREQSKFGVIHEGERDVQRRALFNAEMDSEEYWSSLGESSEKD